MARVTVRTETPEVATTFATLCPTAPMIVDGWGRKAVIEVRGRIWSASRFVYRGIKPRPVKSKSGEAWAHEVAPGGLGLTLVNAATSKRGVAYAKYVHLSGRARSDVLTREIEGYVDATLIPNILAALGREIKRNFTARRVVKVVTSG